MPFIVNNNYYESNLNFDYISGSESGSESESESGSEFESNSEYDSDSDSDHNNNKYNIIMCELYNELIHGISNEEIYTHYLVICKFNKFNIRKIRTVSTFYNTEYIQRLPNITPHTIFRNYSNIILNENYIKPEIAKCIYLQNGECVAILKTFWLRLIQRTWKTIYRQKIQIIKKRCKPESIIYRQITGKWPPICYNMPKLNGMLNYLKR